MDYSVDFDKIMPIERDKNIELESLKVTYGEIWMMRNMDRATGDICHYGDEKRQYLCRHKKGFSCKKCIDLIQEEIIEWGRMEGSTTPP